MRHTDKISAYRRQYKMRIVGDGGVEVSLPKIVVERAARERGITIQEFVARYRLEHLFDDFEGFDGAYRFVEDTRKY